MIKKHFALSIITVLLMLSFSHNAFAQLSLTKPPAATNLISLQPGDTYETYITVKNTYRADSVINVYTVDGMKTSTGTFAAKLKSSEQLFFGEWAKLEEENITLAYNEERDIKMTIKVPANATPGDYSGAIAASRIIAPAVVEETTDDTMVTGVSFSTRIATPYYLRVEGERVSNLEINELTYKALPAGAYNMQLNLNNTGNTSFTVKINPDINSVFGEARQLTEQNITLFAKEKVNVTIPMGQMPIFGIFDLSVDIEYADYDIMTKTKTLAGTVTRSTQLIIIPWREIIIALLILAAIIIFFTAKKLRLNHLRKSSKKYTVKSGDSVMSLAKNSSVSWKTLAKINKLKPPYELKSGQNILIPPKK